MSDKSEEATPKRLQDARAKGQVWKSRDLSLALSWFALLAVVPSTLHAIHVAFGNQLNTALAEARGFGTDPTFGIDPTMLLGLTQASMQQALTLSLVPVGIVLLVGALTTLIQVRPLFAPQAIRLDFSRLDPVKGLQNLVAKKQWVDLAKNAIKLGLAFWVAKGAVLEALARAPGLMRASAWQQTHATLLTVHAISMRLGLLFVALAVLDVLHQRHEFMKSMRMGKDEVKREHKESDGDPHVKQERERLRHEIAHHNMMEQVRNASVLIVNPTHLAIALRFDADDDAQDAPEVVAKGMDGLAQQMIAAALQAGVPVEQDVPLARGLFGLEVGEQIPAELYEAVAAVLATVGQEDILE